MIGLYDLAVLDHLLAGLFNQSKMLLWKERFTVFSALKAVSKPGLVDVSCIKYFCFPSYMFFKVEPIFLTLFHSFKMLTPPPAPASSFYIV